MKGDTISKKTIKARNLLEGNNQSFVEPKVKQNTLVRNTIDIFIVPRT